VHLVGFTIEINKFSCARPTSEPDIIISLCVTHSDLILMAYNIASLSFLYVRATWSLILTNCERVTQICVFNTVKLGTSVSSP